MLVLLIYSAALGWCGTRYPGWWWYLIKHPWPWPGPNPGPDPDPPYRKAGSDPMPGIAAIIGGIAGGYLMHNLLPEESFATIGLAALATGRILSDIAGSMKGSMK